MLTRVRILGNFKLIVGKAAGTRRLDEVYEPLTGNQTSYTFAVDEWPYSTYGKTFFKRVSTEAQQQFKNYLKDFPCTKVTHSLKLNSPSWSCYNNFAHIGNLTYSDVSLYDLSSDPSESYDLYTIEGRFQAKAESMYNKLLAASEGSVHPIAFSLARGKTEVTTELAEDGVTLEWTPFINDGQDYRDFVP